MSGNNHATWWTAQVAAYATLTGDEAVKKMAWEHYRGYLVPEEIQLDGSCPREESAPIRLSYSSMNLDAFAVLCRVAARMACGYGNSPPQGNRSAAAVLLSASVRPACGDLEEAAEREVQRGQHGVAGAGGVGCQSERLLTAYKSLPRGASAWVQFVDMVVKGGLARQGGRI